MTTPDRSSYLENREQTTALDLAMKLVLYCSVLFNVRFETRRIRNPRFGQPDEPEFVTISEGTAFLMDPLTFWFSFVPMAGGLALALSSIPMHPMQAIPFAAGGSVAFVWGALWFVFFTEMPAPLTLVIRQISGTTYLRDCRVTVFTPWIRRLLGIVVVQIPGARGITIESDKSDPDNLLTSHMRIPKETVNAEEDSQVEVSFDGVFVYGLDIRWMHTLKAMFFDDYLANPPKKGESIAEDVQERCRRLIQPVIYAACDPILQQIDWRKAVSAITEINDQLLDGLPHELEHLAIHFETVLLSAAYGVPFTELKRKTDAELKSEAERQVARSNQLAQVAKAEADAAIAEAEADRDRRANVAKENAAKESGLAKQAALRAVADAELGTQKALLLVAEQTAKISVAPLEARLKAIQTNQSSALLDTFTNLNDEGKKAVLVQMMTSLGTSSVPETIVSVANGGGIDSFPVPALLKALQEALSNFMGRPPVPPPTP